MQILHSEPTQPHERLGEISLQPQGNPAVSEMKAKLREAAAKIGVDAAVIVTYTTRPMGSYAMGLKEVRGRRRGHRSPLTDATMFGKVYGPNGRPFYYRRYVSLNVPLRMNPGPEPVERQYLNSITSLHHRTFRNDGK